MSAATPLLPLLLSGDCLTELKRIPDCSVDAIVTDPPYGLSDLKPARIAETLRLWLGGDREHIPDARGVVGHRWDAFVPPPAVWDECARILKPGGHVLAFAGSRTQDLMALSIRLAGFEIRDSIAWLYATGFPKSMDVSKAIDKETGVKRRSTGSHADTAPAAEKRDIPATDAAREWDGWGTMLKPAHEPIIVARKPMPSTVAANVLTHGTGALNLKASRIPGEARVNPARKARTTSVSMCGGLNPQDAKNMSDRFPVNVILDESQAVALEAQSGGASRFFYVAKALRSERPSVGGVEHPTVKPLALMRYIVRLVTPPGGCVVDPFAGSGSTLEAAHLEGFNAIGCELTPAFWPLIEQRIERLQK